MKKINILVVFFLSIISLFGCAGNQKEKALNNRKDNAMQNVRYEGNNAGIQNDRNNPINDNNQTRLEVANKAADRIAELDEVDQANVIVTNNNAYVAVVLKNGVQGNITDQLEKKIADQVRATDPDIRNVFVSSNPDFANRMRDYAEKIKRGEPVEGLVEEFNEAVKRVFPTAR
ncbi:YhcN/YlaJ family sporulation lipoprotein [Bacillus sp. 3103sda1]|uniref:YhcN/YlaJ family sporulation lipoprotein n=1 Tax=Bacillus sp. 3103sda1 TaxID=2953808 RepID=UPI0020A22DC5|nr:YhcN/YlaJ family sporulation lipoprotein [Bacillus sp. 3103sda1]MCP1125064.1 YhcN/YlaJ family sporulation lipoprotein [Bacillus sp. 3103sda1]